MLSKAQKHIIAQVFLFAFILLKASGLHALTHLHHPDQVDKCTLCHVSQRDNTTPNLAPTPIELPVFIVAPIYAEPTVVCFPVYNKKLAINQLVNRPPPVYTVL